MRKRLPLWMKRKISASQNLNLVSEMLETLGLHTVCQSAICPNLGECFSRSTATFMILGDTCTRNCGFCAVQGGRPNPPDPGEQDRVAEACKRLGLKHVVITSVTRDDLPDGGAGQFAATVRSIKERLPHAVVEVLTPDFRGDERSLLTVLEAKPEVFNHNVETVAGLYSRVRPGANYDRSLKLLQLAKKLNGQIFTKSGIMVGLGENATEVEVVMRDLRDVGCDIVTIGQYLQPSPRHLEVEEFVTPEQFICYEKAARELDFKYVASGPFVRSSYHAGEFSEKFMAYNRERLADDLGTGKGQ